VAVVVAGFVDVVVATSSGSDSEKKGKEELHPFDGSTRTHLKFV
jgi:hypothetical protein